MALRYPFVGVEFPDILQHGFDSCWDFSPLDNLCDSVEVLVNSFLQGGREGMGMGSRVSSYLHDPLVKFTTSLVFTFIEKSIRK